MGRRNLVWLAVLAAVAMSPALGDELTPYQTVFLADANKSMALPMRVNGNTMLNGLSFSETTFVYHYEVTDTMRPDMDVEAHRQTQLAKYCAFMMKIFKENEVTALAHDFTFTGGGHARFGVTMDECDAIAKEAARPTYEYFQEQLNKQSE